MSEQLIFDLPARSAFGRDDFFVSPANALALQGVDNWRDWPLGRAVLVGAAGCGKTHLAHVWQSETGARVIDAKNMSALLSGDFANIACLVVEDIDRLAGQIEAERALFHLVNMAQAQDVHLLMTSATAPARLDIGLADLKSRLEATQLVAMEAPDDALLSALLIKQFSDRQLLVNPAVITYMLGRMERSARSAQALVSVLDRQALAQKRAITRAMAGEVLDKLG
ncbi:MAG: chromosomal replication initiator DnaA [Alphaproteobacteria bacterium]|nr:chromosomal replication initiator DnaA [Alphaproteobacteria bacterium]